MAKKNEQYSLRIDLFSETVEDFKKELNNPSFDINFTKEKEYEYKVSISKNGIKSGLRCYLKANGQVSFKHENKTKYKNICERCKDFLIQNTKIEYNCPSYYTVNGVSEDDLRVFVDLFAKNYSYQLKEKENKDKSKICCYIITSEYRETITVSYYISGKLTVQGTKNLPFIRFISEVLVLSVNDDIDSLIKVLDYNDSSIEKPYFNTNLKKYFPSNYDQIHGNIETLLTSSVLLINKPIKLPDYSHNVYGGLRALEGLIKKRLCIEVGPFEHSLLKTYFDSTENKLNNLGLSLAAKKSLKQGYKLYSNNRHGLFHMDSTPDTSRLLTYSESVSLFKDILDVMSDICKNWE